MRTSTIGILLNSPDILSVTGLTFGQTRYQALYKDVQRLIADTASIAVRRNLSIYITNLPIPP